MKQHVRGHWFSAQGHERMFRSLVRNGFRVRWQLGPRDHGGRMYDPNYLEDGTKVVWRMNDRYFDPDVDLSGEVTNLVMDDLGKSAVWRRHSNQDMLRWMRYWLKGEENGIMEEAPVRFIAASCYPGDQTDPVTGYESFQINQYPGDVIQNQKVFLAKGGRISRRSPGPASAVLQNRVDSASPEDPLWVPDGQGTVRRELVFDTATLSTDRVLMGTPTARLFVTPNATEFAMTISVYDVEFDQDGKETNADLITRGPAFRYVKTVDEVMQVDVELDFRVHRFRKGHIMRVVISNLDHLIPQLGAFNFWSAPSFVPSDNIIHMGGEYALSILLPAYREVATTGQ